MLKKTIFLIGIFLLCGYQFSPTNEKLNWTIDLEQETNDSIYLNFSYVSGNLKSLDRVPLFKKRVVETYKGIPINDSISYYGNFENTLQFFYDLYKIKEYDKKEFLDLVDKIKVDTLLFSKTPLKQGFISIIGFYNKKQFLIADANRNEDFGDDIKYEFDINFRKNPLDSLDILNKLPYSEYSYQLYYNGHIQTYKKFFTLYPNKTEPYTLEKKEFEYSSKFRYKDYWKGEKIINNTVFEFYYQSIDNTFGSIYIKPKNIPFSKSDDVYNNQFMHYTTDTIAIAEGYYKIDSINRSISKLYLREISKNKKKYGNGTGSYLRDLVIKDLDGKSFNTGKIVKNKKYTLIEFWGTWCEPCRRMTPILKKTQIEFSSKLNIISIANDKNKEVVKNYVRKSEMNWINGFVDSNERDPILKELNIGLFPTFILLDSTGKILFRGGSDTYDDILKILK